MSSVTLPRAGKHFHVRTGLARLARMSDLRQIRNVINGQTVAADGVTSDLVDPSTGQVFAQAGVSGKADVDAAYAAAAEAFTTWRDTTPSQRQAALLDHQCTPE